MAPPGPPEAADDGGPGPGPAGDGHPVPYADLRAPQPRPAAPPVVARWLAMASILVAGLLGGLIGWGVTDVLTEGQLWPAVGGLAGAVFGAVGVGIVAGLTLQAMGEWHAVRHPEAE